MWDRVRGRREGKGERETGVIGREGDSKDRVRVRSRVRELRQIHSPTHVHCDCWL